jgi:hypothetical protein
MRSIPENNTRPTGIQPVPPINNKRSTPEQEARRRALKRRSARPQSGEPKNWSQSPRSWSEGKTKQWGPPGNWKDRS